jgi:hypothetical protein
VATEQRVTGATRTQVAVRAATAFGAIVVTMAIWWPAGIAVALIVCGVATVLANRMLQVPVEGALEADLLGLFSASGSDEALQA